MRGLLLALGVVAACIGAPSGARAQDNVNDPFEGANRGLFAAHEAVDQAVIEPIARGYRAVAPEPMRNGVVNFLRNLRAPVIFANDVLQGEFARAGVTAARFGVNTTIGVLGALDAAEGMGLERHNEDFGQTLAVWGMAEGPYIFVPILGPTNLRDGAGRIIDMALDPLAWAEFDGYAGARAARGLATGVSARERLLETVDGVRRDALDPYVSIRTSYGLLRASAIQNGRNDVQDLPEFEEIPDLSAAPEEALPVDQDEPPPAAPAAPAASIGDAK